MMPITERQPLDDLDLKILSELQRDGRIRNNELAERVGISEPPCRRRGAGLWRSGVGRALTGPPAGRAAGEGRHLGATMPAARSRLARTRLCQRHQSHARRNAAWLRSDFLCADPV